jgi:hypothetical protein
MQAMLSLLGRLYHSIQPVIADFQAIPQNFKTQHCSIETNATSTAPHKSYFYSNGLDAYRTPHKGVRMSIIYPAACLQPRTRQQVPKLSYKSSTT